MGTGKQLSFAYGEVSKLLQYKADAPFYPSALAQAVNGQVRKTGGFSNRSGTLYLPIEVHQKDKFTDGVSGIRTMTLGKFLIVVQRYVEETPEGWDFGPDPFNPNYYNRPLPFKIYDLSKPYFDAEMDYETPSDGFWKAGVESSRIMFDIDASSVSAVDGFICITMYEVYDDGHIPYVFSFKEVYPTPDVVTYSVLRWENVVYKPEAIGTKPAGLGAIANVRITETLNAPVCYAVTQEKVNGEEVHWAASCYTLGHPHDQSQSHISFNIDISKEIKQYSIYRSSTVPTNSGDGVFGGVYGLVGRIYPRGVSVKFGDYLTTPDMTVQPPNSETLLPPVVHRGDGSFAEIKNYPVMRRVVKFKERTIVAYGAPIANSKKGNVAPINAVTDSIGSIGASKLGTRSMFLRSGNPHPIDAFSFSVPRQKLNSVNHVKAGQGLLVFTDDSVILAQGDENGLLSFDTVNPVVVSNEGCPLHVEPDEGGDLIYYVNTDLSKLMASAFNNQGRGAEFIDLSSISSHLFEYKDSKRVVATVGEVNQIWILNKRGFLFCATHSVENSVIGFSRIYVNGFVEDICQVNANNYLYTGSVASREPVTQTILMTVIRDGVRYIEYLHPRNDLDRKRMLFADSASVFGDLGVNAVLWNITAVDFSGGFELTISTYDWPYGGYFTEGMEGEVIAFDFEGKRIEIKLTEFVDGSTFKAISEYDIPEGLQDVASKGISEESKRAIMEKSYFLHNKVEGLERFASKAVSVYADLQVISSPLNPRANTLTVGVDGVLDLGGYYRFGYVGLPYEYLAETLRLEASDNRTFSGKGKNINAVKVAYEKTQGGFVSQYANSSLEFEAEELVVREDNPSLSEPTIPVSGLVSRSFPAHWNDTGSLCIRQVDPLPITIVAVYPEGEIGD